MSDAMPTEKMNVTFDVTDSDRPTYFVAFDSGKVSNVLWKYVLPVQIVFGTCGNLMSALIMARPNLRRSVTALLLQALAAADTLVLLFAGVVTMLQQGYDLDLRQTQIGCPATSFCMYFTFMAASWILTCVSLERFIVVIFPHKAKEWVTRRRAIITIGVIVSALALINAHVLWNVRSNISEDGPICRWRTESAEAFMKGVWPWIDMVIYVMVPFLLICVANIAIILKLTMSRLRQRQIIVPVNTQRVSQRAKVASMTVVLVTISVVFLVTTLPLELFILFESPWNTAGEDPERAAFVSMMWAILVEVGFVNYSTNFVWYCLSSPVFRSEFLAMLAKCKRMGAVVVNESLPADTAERRFANTSVQ